MDPNNQRLEELYSDAQTFVSSFNALTGAHMGIHDMNYTISIASAHVEKTLCTFCKNRSQGFLCKCKCDDMLYLEKAAQTKEITTFKCHLGVTSVIIPIVKNDLVTGVMDFGMILVLPDPEMEFETLFTRLNRKYPSSFPVNEKEGMRQAYENTPQMTPEQLQHYTNFSVFAMRGLFLDELFPTNILKKEAQLQVYMKYLCIESIPLSTFIVTDVANILNISCTQLRRLSQKVYGMPLKQYVLSKKMKNAVLIMTKHPNMTIKEISESVGIEDPKYFSRLFHKQMGCSCSEYYNTIKTDKKK